MADRSLYHLLPEQSTHNDATGDDDPLTTVGLTQKQQFAANALRRVRTLQQHLVHQGNNTPRLDTSRLKVKFSIEHAATIRCLVLSSDGQKLFAGSADGKVLIVAVETGAVEKVVEHGDDIKVMVLSGDGEKLYTASNSSTANVHIIDVKAGSMEKSIEIGRPVVCMALSGNGPKLYTGSCGEVCITDVVGGTREVLIQHAEDITCMALSGDGHKLYNGLTNGKVYFLDMKTITVERVIELGHGGRGVSWDMCMALSADGLKLCTGFGNETHTIDTKAGVVEEVTVIGGLAMGVTCLALSGDGQKLSAGSGFGSCQTIVDVKTGTVDHVTEYGNEIEDCVKCMAWSFHGQKLCTGKEGGKVEIADMEPGTTEQVIAGSVSFMALSSDWQKACISYDDKACIIDMKTSKIEHVIAHEGSGLCCLALSDDGQKLCTGYSPITGSGDGKARIIATKTGTVEHAIKTDDGIICMALSRDGQKLCTGSGTRFGSMDEFYASVFYQAKVRIIDTKSGTIEHVIDYEKCSTLLLALSDDGQKLCIAGHFMQSPTQEQQAAGSLDGKVQVIDVTKGSVEKVIEYGVSHGAEFNQDLLVNRMALSGWDGKKLCIGHGNKASIIDVKSGTIENVIDHGGIVNGLVVSKDCQKLCTRSWDSNVRIIDMKTGTVKHVILTGQKDGSTLALSADGQKLCTSFKVSGSTHDVNACIFNTNTGLMEQFIEHRGVWTISCAEFINDGQRLCTVSSQGVRILPLMGLQCHVKLMFEQPISSAASVLASNKSLSTERILLTSDTLLGFLTGTKDTTRLAAFAEADPTLIKTLAKDLGGCCALDLCILQRDADTIDAVLASLKLNPKAIETCARSNLVTDSLITIGETFPSKLSAIWSIVFRPAIFTDKAVSMASGVLKCQRKVLWRALTFNDFASEITNQAQYPVKVFTINMFGLFTPDFAARVVQTFASPGAEDALRLPGPQQYLEHLWGDFGFKRHMLQTLLQCVAFACFTSSVLAKETYRQGPLPKFGLVGSSGLLALHQLCNLAQDPRAFSSSLWQCLSLGLQACFMCTATLGSVPLRIQVACSFFGWIGIVAQFRFQRQFGGLLRTITETLSDIRWFLLIIFAMLCGTSQAQLLIEGTDVDSPEIFSMLLQSYRLAILGDFDADSYAKDPCLTMVFLATTFFVLVVLLNMLIAIMGDTYDRVQEQSTVLFYQARAGLLLDYWRLPCIGVKQALLRTYTEDHYLHLRIPVEWVGSDGAVEQEVAWEGRLRKLMRRNDELEATMTKNFQEQAKKTVEMLEIIRSLQRPQ